MRKSLNGALVALALAVAAPVNAVTFDAFGSFDGVNNPAGPFSFGYIDPALTTFTAFSDSDFSACFTGLSCLTSPVEPSLGAYKNISGGPLTVVSTVDVPAGALFVHPGTSLLSAIVFTAPTSGTYDIGFFGRLLSNSTITGTQLFTGTLDGNSVFDTDLGPMLTQAMPSFGFAGTTWLTAGNRVFVAVGPAGDYTFDSTQIIFRFSTGAVPEPTSWALLVAGFGLVGAAMRRRRAVLASVS